jgi:hypothetical protein
MTDIIKEFKTLIDTHIIESKPIDEIIYNEFIEKIYKVKHNKYMSNYIKDKQSIKCPCGGIYKQHQHHIHRKSLRHIKHFTTTETKEN